MYVLSHVPSTSRFCTDPPLRVTIPARSTMLASKSMRTGCPLSTGNPSSANPQSGLLHLNTLPSLTSAHRTMRLRHLGQATIDNSASDHFLIMFRSQPFARHVL